MTSITILFIRIWTNEFIADALSVFRQRKKKIMNGSTERFVLNSRRATKFHNRTHPRSFVVHSPKPENVWVVAECTTHIAQCTCTHMNVTHFHSKKTQSIKHCIERRFYLHLFPSRSRVFTQTKKIKNIKIDFFSKLTVHFVERPCALCVWQLSSSMYERVFCSCLIHIRMSVMSFELLLSMRRTQTQTHTHKCNIHQVTTKEIRLAEPTHTDSTTFLTLVFQAAR